MRVELLTLKNKQSSVQKIGSILLCLFLLFEIGAIYVVVVNINFFIPITIL